MQSSRSLLLPRRCLPNRLISFLTRGDRRKKSHNAQLLSPKEIDAKWQQRWREAAHSSLSDQQLVQSPKSYVLPMFAYPSGSLHMGHLRVYTISDVIARYRRMQGYNVLHPTGWDAFGLPAENAALERGIDPTVWTNDNIAKMKTQLIGMNTSFDWDREFRTCDPSFYKHTQKIFLMLHKRGLAYQAEALVNYDPVDKTVLANEQVDSEGRSWRSGAVVQEMNLKQWFFKITAFKEALLDDLDILLESKRWPERVVSQQRNWLGKSEGARIKFDVRVSYGKTDRVEKISIFTTRPDTLFGVRYLALSMSHPLVLEIASHNATVQAFLDQKSSFSTDNKAGLVLQEIVALNPARTLLEPGEDYTRAEPFLPVYVAPYVLDGYGDGAVMGVPAHDHRDLAFWKQQQPKSDVRVVVSSAGTESSSSLICTPDKINQAYTERGILTGLNGIYSHLDSYVAAREIVFDLQAEGRAEPIQNWRLRDWLVSRQRYWGTPIPIIHCEGCGAVPVPEEDLPVELPKLDKSAKGVPGNPLEKVDSWVNVLCPSCHGPAKRDTDTMDTFVDSSWYFLRFLDPRNEKEPFSVRSVNSMIPVDTYVGGVEHAILHLLYARFIHKFLAREGLIHNGALHQEPFTQLIAQGMVHGKTFSDAATGRFLTPAEVDENEAGSPIVRSTGKPPAVSWEKMSKSKHNGVDPMTCIDKFGADAVRAHILFAAPVSEVLQWDEEKIVGIQRWFHRISRLISAMQEIFSKYDVQLLRQYEPHKLKPSDIPLFLFTQETIKSVTHTFKNDVYSLNTAVSDLIKLTNALSESNSKNITPWVLYDALTSLLRMLSPIAPAFAEQCWEELHLRFLSHEITPESRRHNFSVFGSPWPRYTLTKELKAEIEAMNTEATIVCAVQVNGKLRFTLNVPASIAKEQKQNREALLLEMVLNSEDGRQWLQEKNDWEKRKRVLVVGDGKLLNVVF